MSGLLFLLNVAATVLIALWLWGVERSGEGRRVRIFDMRGEAPTEAGASARSAPRWSRPKPEAETPPLDGRPLTNFRRDPATSRSTQPRWRRSV
jgi:hypothetical protein